MTKIDQQGHCSLKNGCWGDEVPTPIIWHIVFQLCWNLINISAHAVMGILLYFLLLFSKARPIGILRHWRKSLQFMQFGANFGGLTEVQNQPARFPNKAFVRESLCQRPFEAEREIRDHHCNCLASRWLGVSVFVHGDDCPNDQLTSSFRFIYRNMSSFGWEIKLLRWEMLMIRWGCSWYDLMTKKHEINISQKSSFQISQSSPTICNTLGV